MPVWIYKALTALCQADLQIGGIWRGFMAHRKLIAKPWQKVKMHHPWQPFMGKTDL